MCDGIAAQFGDEERRWASSTMIAVRSVVALTRARVSFDVSSEHEYARSAQYLSS